MNPIRDEWTSPDGAVRLILGDALEVLPTLDREGIGAVVTDPPYPDYYVEEYAFDPRSLAIVCAVRVRQFVFWSGDADFPLDFTAVHIWNKNPSNHGAQYERVFERNGGTHRKVWTRYMVNSSVAAQMTRDVLTGHPSQKPIALLRDIVGELPKGVKVFDPFTGSGTTGVACIRTGRRFIGIEIEPKYFQIAVQRCERELNRHPLFEPPGKKQKELIP